MFTGTLYPFQEEAKEDMVDRGTMLLAFYMGLGKGHIKVEPVLTPTGWTSIGDIKVGDQVVGVDGKPTTVLGVFPQGKKAVRRVTFNDGSWTLCDIAHLWTVSSDNGKVWRTVTTEQIEKGEVLYEENYTKGPRWSARLHQSDGVTRRLRIPMTAPVVHGYKTLPIDPYALGVWLGDGSHGGSLGLNINDAGHICGRIGVAWWGVKNCPGAATARLGTAWMRRVPELVGKRSWEKFIPEVYLRSSIDQRLALLQGLMDTDGSALPDGGTEYSSTSEQLIDGIVDLVNGLGGVARKKGPRITHYPYEGEQLEGRPSWRLNIKLPSDLEPFSTPRKLDGWVRPTKYPPKRMMVSITPEPDDDTVCIKVAAADGLYLTRFHIVTHNTPTTIAVLEALREEGEIDKALIVVPSSLKYQWLREFKKFTDARAIVIDGSPKQRIDLWRHAHRVPYVIANPEMLMNDRDMLKRHTFEAMVLDEATMIKGPSTQRSKAMKRISRRVPYRYALSGQPIENRPEELFSIMEFVDPTVFGDPEIFDATFIVRNTYGKIKRVRNLPLLHKAVSDAMVRKTRNDVKDQLPQIIYQVIPVDFDTAGAVLYRRMTNDLQNIIASVIPSTGRGFSVYEHYSGEGTNSEAQGQIMSRMTCMRMLCDNVELLRLSAELRQEGTGMSGGSEYAAKLASRGVLDKVKATPKLDTTVELIEEILAEDRGNKVVLFSFFKENLRIIKKATARFTDSVLFMGGMNAKERDAAKQRFAVDPRTRLFLSSDAGGYGVDLPMANYLLCVKADMPVLTDDLRWVPAGSLREGDGLLACEEHAAGGRGNSRRWQQGTVLKNRVQPMSCVSVNLSNGESLIVTPQHPLLVQTGKGTTKWVEAQHLAVGWRVHKYTQMWDTPQSFDGGWMSGFLDGEGCVSKIGHGIATTITQNRGPVLDKALAIAKDHGFDMRDSGREGHCPQYVVGGGKAEAMRFLGTFQPVRLVPTWVRLVQHHQLRAIETATVVSVTPAGVHDVSVLGTSTRTFIGAGYAQHNSYDLPWSAGKIDQREARIVRLSSDFRAVTLISMVMRGSIEEYQYDLLQQKRAVGDAVIDGKFDKTTGSYEMTLGTLSDFLARSTV